MKKLCVAIGALVLGMFLMPSNAMAILCFPDLQFDSTGIAEYIQSTGKFTITAETDYVVFDSSLTKYRPDYTDDISVNFWAEYVSGGNSGGHWHFQGDSAHADPDIVIMGTLVSPPSGCPTGGTGRTLIEGNITSMTYDNNNAGYVTGLFDITAGDLYSYYAGTGYEGMFLINLEFGIGSTTPSGSGSDFKSVGAKGDISPTPEPSSMLLLGMGLFGFAGRAFRKKRFKA